MTDPPRSGERGYENDEIMFSDTKFWHLVWKEYRTQRALWLTLLIVAPVLQAAPVALMWWTDDFRPLQPDPRNDGTRMGWLVIGYLAVAIYVLGCASTLFSVEHEAGTFDFQRVLPANPPRVFWAKIWFALVSSLALALLLSVITRGLFVPTLPKDGSWFFGLGGLLLIELFVWSVLCSLLIKQPLWGVIAALLLQTSVIGIALPNLIRLDLNIDRWSYADVRLTNWRVAIVVILAVTDIVLGKLWFEDRLRLPRFRFRWRREIVPSYPSNAELPTYSGQHQAGWSRMLWLSWRDGRWLIAGFLAWFANDAYEFRHLHAWEQLVLPGYLASFAFGVFAFASEQWRGRFRFMAERGCAPRHAWLCRQAIYLPPVLLICLVMAWMRSFESGAIRHLPGYAAQIAQREMTSAIFPLMCYSAGQFAAMLIRSTVVAIAVGVALAAFGFMWGNGMTSWLAPAWWSVGSLPVIGLFVTWLKANDWVEERRDRVARWRLTLGLGIPIAVLLATCATYRVVQIPVVQLPAEWDQVDDAESKLSPDEKETLKLYRRAYAERIRAAQKHFANTETRLREIQLAHPDWDDNQRRNEDEKTGREQWFLEMLPVVELLAEAHSRPDVALEFLNSELPHYPVNTLQSDAWSDFSMVLMDHARRHVNEGNLDGAWRAFEIEWELLRRAQLRVTADSFDPIAPYEEWLREEIVKWGRHPNQSRDGVLKAIRRLEAVAQQDVVRNEIHRQLVTSRSLVEDFERWHRYVLWRHRRRIEYGEELGWWIHWRIQPWERWRFERLLRRQAFFAISSADGLKRQLESQQPLSLAALNVSLGPYPHERTLLEDTTLPANSQGGFQVTVFSQFLSRAEAFRATMLRLALLDFQREHGRFPKSLSELVPTYFTEVPRDASTGGEFGYFPNGVGEDVIGAPTQRNGFPIEYPIRLPKGVPFLLTTDGTGSPLRRRGRDGDWEFTDLAGKDLSIQKALAFARIWQIDPQQPSSE